MGNDFQDYRDDLADLHGPVNDASDIGGESTKVGRFVANSRHYSDKRKLCYAHVDDLDGT